MTYTIKRIDIRGFQKNRDISVSFRDDVNFIIGRNGTGKTTFVRLLHSCLNIDLEELTQSDFESISISFTDSDSGLTPLLRIERTSGSRLPTEISFRPAGNQTFQKYYIDTEDPVGRGTSADQIYFATLLKRSNQRDLKPLSDLRKSLRATMQFSWLPLVRSRTTVRRNEFYVSEPTEEPINRKIKELVGAMTAYLSLLDSRISDFNNKFQRDVFHSYIENQGLFNISSIKNMNLEEEKSHLLSMFREMEYFSGDVMESLESFFSRAAETVNSIDPSAQTRTVTEVVNVVSINALHKIVTAFQNYTKSKDDTLFPKNQFLKLLNTLLYQKEVYFDKGNVLQVRVKQNELPTINLAKLDLFDLSSGERQLLIILSETLLQQRKSYIFIADEPELSLHIEWQVKLVSTIRELNNKAQIIFATHSPDIVSTYQDCVIDFEKL